jgi:Na+/proline symporter
MENRLISIGRELLNGAIAVVIDLCLSVLLLTLAGVAVMSGYNVLAAYVSPPGLVLSTFCFLLLLGLFRKLLTDNTPA